MNTVKTNIEFLDFYGLKYNKRNMSNTGFNTFCLKPSVISLTMQGFTNTM